MCTTPRAQLTTGIIGHMTSKVGVLGDTHGDLGWTLAAMHSAREAGARLLLQCGDWAIDWPGKNKRQYGDKLQREAEKLGMTIAFTRGNHDCVPSLAIPKRKGESFSRIRDDIFHLDGDVLEWNGSRIGFLGGATSHPDDFAWRMEEEQKHQKNQSLWWPGEQVSREAAMTLSMQEPVDIFISHDAPLVGAFLELPRRSDDVDYRREAQLDRELITRTRAKILKPGGISFCGHWHQRLSTEDDLGRIEMLGRDGDRTGALVVLDTRSGVLSPVEVKFGL